jgi:hypothetical protein
MSQLSILPREFADALPLGYDEMLSQLQFLGIDFGTMVQYRMCEHGFICR